jgi:hypothetical protein
LSVVDRIPASWHAPENSVIARQHGKAPA